MKYTVCGLACLMFLSLGPARAQDEEPLTFTGPSAESFYLLLQEYEGQILESPMLGYIRSTSDRFANRLELRDPEGSLAIYMSCAQEHILPVYTCWMDAPWREVVDKTAAVWQVLGETLFDMAQLAKGVNLLKLAGDDPWNAEIEFEYGNIRFICEELERKWNTVRDEEIPANECASAIVEFPL